MVIAASPQRGFNFPYVLKLPTVLSDRAVDYLLVEPNNTGALSDDLMVHLRAARLGTERAFVANRLNLPFLVPVFPRPESDRRTYTHALDRDTIDIQTGDLRRLDLQLIAMIEDAQQRLRDRGVDLDPKVLMAGFSASATFVNRFAMLHPERVAAAATGGLNGILMLPLSELEGVELPYPLGISDYEELFGRPFDYETWRRIPQFIFMGETDDNDSVPFDDAYSETEKGIIRAVIGERMQPDRWEKCQEIYRSLASAAVLSAYPGIGHATNRAINIDMAEFLRTSVER